MSKAQNQSFIRKKYHQNNTLPWSVPMRSNKNIGKGMVIHPSIPVIGLFKNEVNLEKGLTASVYNASFALKPGHGYLFESMSASPGYIAAMLHFSPRKIRDTIKKYRCIGGFGVMLIDSIDKENKVYINDEQADIEEIDMLFVMWK